MKTRSIFTIVIFLLLMVAGIYYIKWGGLKEIELEVADQPKLYFTGVSYYGIVLDKSLDQLKGQVFEQVVKNKTLSGEFSICYLGNPDQDQDSIKIWVGATSTVATPENKPEGYTTWELPKGKVLRATINAYSVVVPNSYEINERLKELAIEKGVTPDNIYLERYPKIEQIFNEIYVKP